MATTTEILPSEMEARTARFRNLKGSEGAFVDSFLPSGRKKNFKLVSAGLGIVEDETMRPAINAPHGLNMSWVHIYPGGGSNLHDHPGSQAEIFIPITGPVTIYWGSSGQYEIGLAPHDCISVPEGVMRGFRNDTQSPVLMLAIVDGGAAGGSRVKWHQDVLAAAEKAGVTLDENGKLRNPSAHT